MTATQGNTICKGCGKDAGPSYVSHPMTDLPGTDGVNWGDTAMVLCDACEENTRHFKAAVDFINWRNRTYPRPAPPVRQHTPGPWHSFGTDGEPGVGITGYGVLVCEPGDDEGRLLADELNKADADLIAAAPDLLDACREFLGLCERMGVPVLARAVKLGKAAVAKATGN